ncbi:MAG: flagellar basal body P-ring protein FlgI [Geminicoccales bacterium]
MTRPRRLDAEPLRRLVALLLASLALVLALVVVRSGAADAASVRIKDIVNVQGVRGNDLVGYGLIVGLNGTGDSLRSIPFTEDSLINLLERLGVNVEGEQVKAKNVAAVIVTATLPPFARSGSEIDATISAIGDAESLLGGTLVLTPLLAADGKIYAVAQGTVIAGGFEAGGSAETVTQGVPTSGVIPSGARVEQEVDFALDELRTVRLALRDPDFTTAQRIQGAINREVGLDVARTLDSGTIDVVVPAVFANRVAAFVSAIENLSVTPDLAARVVVDQRSGTIVVGADVRISEVAVSQGNLTVRVTETPQASQPNPFGEGRTVVVPRTDVEVDTQANNRIAVLNEGTTLAALVRGLNALGVGPRDQIDILSTIKAAGALHAEFIVR